MKKLKGCVKGCDKGKGVCVKCEKLRKQRARKKFIAAFISTALDWVWFVVCVVVLGLIAQLLHIDMALFFAGGALGLSWYHTFIERDKHCKCRGDCCKK